MAAALISPQSAATERLEQTTERGLALVRDAKELGIFTELHELRFGARDAKLPRDFIDGQLGEADNVDVQLTAHQPQRIDDLVVPSSELDDVTANGRARVAGNEREA